MTWNPPPSGWRIRKKHAVLHAAAWSAGYRAGMHSRCEDQWCEVERGYDPACPWSTPPPPLPPHYEGGGCPHEWMTTDEYGRTITHRCIYLDASHRLPAVCGCGNERKDR
jgi:hypothetical protein